MGDEPTKSSVDNGASDEEIARLQAKHDRLVQGIERKYTMLNEKFGVVIPPENLVGKRLTYVIDQLFPPGTAKRLELEIGWQEWFAAQLEDIHAGVLQAEREAKSRIVVPGGPGLIVPGRG